MPRPRFMILADLPEETETVVLVLRQHLELFTQLDSVVLRQGGNILVLLFLELEFVLLTFVVILIISVVELVPSD